MKRNPGALKKALQTATMIMLAFEGAGAVLKLTGAAKDYLRMDVLNPVHQLIFAGVALAAGGYSYLRECMKDKAEQEKDPVDGKETGIR